MKITNRHLLPEPLVYDDEKKSVADFSVTELIAPPRQAVLTRKHNSDIEVDASERIWLLMGTAIHNLLSKKAKPNDMVEQTFIVRSGDNSVSGTIDHYDIKEKILSDYKVTSVGSFRKGDKPEWEQQLNVYAYLMEENGFPVEKIRIVAILRDWFQMAALSQSYPPVPVLIKEVQRWSREATEAFIKERINLHKKAVLSLPECTEEEMWASPDRWAVKKQGAKRAMKIYDSHNEALAASYNIRGSTVEVREAERTRCQNYCVAAGFCTQFMDWKMGQETAGQVASEEQEEIL